MAGGFLDGGLDRPLRGGVARDCGLDRRDEPIAPARDGLDVGRLGGIVAKRLPELGDRLCERVVGDGNVRPERREELVLRNQRRLPRHEIEQEIDDLRRQRNDFSAAQKAVRAGIDGKGPEAVRRNHCH